MSERGNGLPGVCPSGFTKQLAGLFWQRLLSWSRLSPFFVLLMPSSLWGQFVGEGVPLVTESSPRAERLVANLQSDISNSDWERVFAAVSRLQDEHSGELIPLTPLYRVEATLLADMFRSRLPHGQEARVEQLPVSGHQSHMEMFRSVLRGEIDPASLSQLGDEAWQAGDLAEAGRFWKLAIHLADSVPRQTDFESESLRAHVQARLIVRDLFLGRFRSADTQIQLFREEFEALEGRLAGKSGNLGLILEELRRSLQSGDDESFVHLGRDFPLAGVRIGLVRKRWSLPRETDPDQLPNSIPILWNDVLLIQNESGVRALSLETGRAAWPLNADDPGWIFETGVLGDRSRDAPMVVEAGMLYESAWYGRTGLSQFVDSMRLTEREQSRVSKLNLAAEGRLEWTVRCDRLPSGKSEQPRLFTGAPVGGEGEVYLPLRSAAPENQLQVVSLDQSTGEVRWLTDVAASLRSLSTLPFPVPDQLVCQNGLLYWWVDGSVLCCLDASSGTVQWISGVPAREFEAEEPSPGSILVEEDTVYCSTLRGVAAFDALSGDLLWEQRMDEIPHELVGVCDGVLIAANPGLCGIDTLSGRRLWMLRENRQPVPNYHAVLQGRYVLSGMGPELITVDALTGELIRRDRVSQVPRELQHDEERGLESNTAAVVADSPAPRTRVIDDALRSVQLGNGSLLCSWSGSLAVFEVREWKVSLPPKFWTSKPD